MLKKLLKRLKGEEEYDNRFVKFYHLNRKRLTKERKSTYNKKKRSRICVRCNDYVVEGIVFCKYHQKKQKEYNRRARSR